MEIQHGHCNQPEHAGDNQPDQQRREARRNQGASGANLVEQMRRGDAQRHLQSGCRHPGQRVRQRTSIRKASAENRTRITPLRGRFRSITTQTRRVPTQTMTIAGDRCSARAGTTRSGSGYRQSFGANRRNRRTASPVTASRPTAPYLRESTIASLVAR